MPPTSLPTSAADDAVKQREPPAKHHNATTPRAPRPAIEALLDRRRPAALPALSPQPTPGNSTSAEISLNFDDLPCFRELRLRALQPPLQTGDLLITAIGRLTPARAAELLQPAVLALLTPVRQMRRVQPLAAHLTYWRK